ncbi:MAG TPA: YhjD/YihY/BrkB family envelope integrity protein, partial [Bryobacteraceae bacterium]|nr:YhjD/YihY/BrkB family envelope integrity protein [Bryobacteraceae bacterium]
MSGVRKFGGLSWKELLKRVWHEVGADDVLGQAAQLSFYFLLALFPLLLFLTTLFGYFAQSDELRDSLLGYFRRVAPVSAFRLIRETLLEISSGAGRGKLSIGLIGTLWAASKGMAALTAGLNRAYDVKDERPWWKVRLIAIGLTVALSVFTVISQTLILGGGKLGAALAGFAPYRKRPKWEWMSPGA